MKPRSAAHLSIAIGVITVVAGLWQASTIVVHKLAMREEQHRIAEAHFAFLSFAIAIKTRNRDEIKRLADVGLSSEPVDSVIDRGQTMRLDQDSSSFRARTLAGSSDVIFEKAPPEPGRNPWATVRLTRTAAGWKVSRMAFQPHPLAAVFDGEGMKQLLDKSK